VESPLDLQQMVLAQSIDDQVTITLQREGETMELTTRLDQLPDQREAQAPREPTDEAEPTMLDKIGLSLSTVPASESGELGLRRDHSVFVVEGVAAGSPAAEIGLREGHVIISADRHVFDSVEDLNQYLQEKSEQGSRSVLLLVKQDDTFYYRGLTLPES
jgi:serine protease Do